MRTELGKIGSDKRHKFTAEFVRFGTKNGFGYIKETLLLQNIKDKQGNIVCDHLWWDLGKRFKELNLQPGDKIEFEARVSTYEKGYKNFYRDDEYAWEMRMEHPIETDYRLSNPTKVRKC